MKVSRILLSVLVVTVVANVALAGLTYYATPRNAGMWKLQDQGPEVYYAANNAIIWNPLTSSEETIQAPEYAPGSQVEFSEFQGRNSAGTVVAGSWYVPNWNVWTRKDGTWTEHSGLGSYRRATDMNENYAVGRASSATYIMDLSDLSVTWPAGLGVSESQKISTNGVISVNKDWTGGAISLDTGVTWRHVTYPILDVNDSGNAIALDLVGDKKTYYYDYASDSFTEITLFGAGDPTDYVQPVAINNHNQVLAGQMRYDAPNWLHRYGFIYDGNTGTKTNILDLIDDEPSDILRGLYDINDLGWISGKMWVGDYQDFVAYAEIGPAHNPGDVNGDDFVGGADLTKIIDNWGLSPADWADGDIDPFDAGDDFIGGADYTQVLNNWGTSYASEAVPEPATIGLLILGSLGLLRKRK